MTPVLLQPTRPGVSGWARSLAPIIDGTTVQVANLFSLGGVTGTTVCEDLNNDGLLDLVNFEIVHGDVGTSSDPTEVLVNTGESPIRLERPGPEATGLYREEETPFWDHGDMTGAVFDVDNDGLKDIYIGAAEYAGNRGWLFRQNADLTFEAVSTDDSFLRWRAHGVAVADFDRDGDVDIVVGHSHFRCEGFWDTECDETRQVRLYENGFGNQNNWIQIRPLAGTSELLPRWGRRSRCSMMTPSRSGWWMVDTGALASRGDPAPFRTGEEIVRRRSRSNGWARPV